MYFSLPIGLFLLSLSLDFIEGQRNVFIQISRGPESVFDKINSMSFKSREEKITTLRSELIKHASVTQDPIIKFLKLQSLTSSIQYESFWISNEIFVKRINGGLLSNILSLFKLSIASISDESFASFNTDFVPSVKQTNTNYTWGLRKIEAPQAWALPGGNNGKGVVVGSIDSGVRYTHETLRSNFVGSYGWYDPANKTATPNDQNGHGTHTMATVCGSKGVGVAPGATWMACKGCAGSSCGESDLKACFQFMLCPTDTNGNNPQCGKAPVVVNNSWGSVIRSTSYRNLVRAWRTADIFPVFSNGNSGPFCSTAGSPADDPNVIGVGSTTESDSLSYFSSKGPVEGFLGILSRLKPDISGPGSDVYSAWKDSDTSYNTISGTSMSGPHVTGVVALLLAAKKMTYAETQDMLIKGVDTDKLKPPMLPVVPCQIQSIFGYRFPNNEYGYGLVNARKSLQMTLNSRRTKAD